MIGDLERFKTLIKQHAGLMLEGAAEETLKSALEARMSAGNFADGNSYFLRLLKDDAEFHELVTLLTINETYFFREPEQLSFLIERLIPRLLAERDSGRPIRILSAGCSTGEEPYSIAMALLDAYGDAASRLFTLMGGDIDHTVLARARAGHYGAFSFRGLSPERREKYFTPFGRTGFALNDQVKRMVGFHHLNLRSSKRPEDLSDFDVILFRNVSIYFDTPTRREIQENLSKMMADKAALLVGVAETLANDLGVLRQVEEDGMFYFVNGAAPAQPEQPPRRPIKTAPPVQPVPAPRPRPRPVPAQVQPDRPPPRPAPPVGDLDQARRLIVAKKFDEALALLAARSQQDKSVLLLTGYALLQIRDFDGAEAAARKVLDADPWCTEAGVLLGFAAKWRNQPDQALQWFKQAVYGKHDCWVAQYYLAEAHRGLGNSDAAKRAYRAALQHLSAAPDPDGGLALPLGLPVGDIRFLCERQAGGRG